MNLSPRKIQFTRDTDEDGECISHTFTPAEIIKLEKQIFWRHAK